MGRKDAARFIKLEDRIRMLEINQDKLIAKHDYLIKVDKLRLKKLRDLLTVMIEAD